MYSKKEATLQGTTFVKHAVYLGLCLQGRIQRVEVLYHFVAEFWEISTIIFFLLYIFSVPLKTIKILPLIIFKHIIQCQQVHLQSCRTITTT